jgi:hypothetical protein
VAVASIKTVLDYFKRPGDTLKGFRAEWDALSEESRAQLREGIGNGTETY